MLTQEKTGTINSDVIPPITEGVVRSNGRFNRAALRRHALKVSQQTRAGKFQRVREEFLNSREAAVEAFFRKMRAPVSNAPLGQVECTEDFLTGEGKKALVEMFNKWIAGEIHNAVNEVRVGKTL